MYSGCFNSVFCVKRLAYAVDFADLLARVPRCAIGSDSNYHFSARFFSNGRGLSVGELQIDSDCRHLLLHIRYYAHYS